MRKHGTSGEGGGGEGSQLLMGCPEQMWALFITVDQRAFFMPPRLRIKKDALSS